MRFTVVTIFPDMFASVLDASMLGRARAAGLLAVDFVDPRDFTADKHRSVDDSPYGGGPGMVMKVEPLVAAIESIGGEPHRVLMSPAGAPLRQARVRQLAELDHIVLVCGRYEGIDERVTELAIDEELSLGDFVLTGGELAAMAVIDSVARFVPGVLGESTSTDEESFSEGLLEYPQYTRPAEFRDRAVPDILLSGDHARIAAWRRERSVERTAARRPELAPRADIAARTHVALVHHPVYDRNGRVVTTAVTNLDLHDIARSAATYGLAGVHIVTPVAAQREKIDRILSVWDGRKDDRDNRPDALAQVRPAASIEAVVAELGDPLVVATTASTERCEAGSVVGPADFPRVSVEVAPRPVLLVFGTGWGLTDEIISESDQILAPIRGAAEFNHLSVRSAVAVVLDRLFGARGGHAA